MSSNRQKRELVELYAVLVAAGLFLLTLLAAWYSYEAAGIREETRFREAALRISHSIERRVQTYINALYAVRAHLSSIGRLSAADFYTYAEQLNLGERYPGIQGLGFTLRVRPEEEEALIRRMREHEGVPHFTLYPKESDAERHAIIYLYPVNRRNSVAIGYNMFSEEARRSAMEQARDTGEPAASGVVTLVQEIDLEKQPGFLVYLPVYSDWQTPAAVEERREKLLGFAYSPFRVDDLLQAILIEHGANDVGFRIYAPGAGGSLVLVHSSDEQGMQVASRFFLTRRLNVGGREWKVEFYARPGFEGSARAGMALWIMLAGSAVSLALGGGAHLRTRYYRRIAASERRLKESEARFRLMADSAPVLIWMSDRTKAFIWFNRPWLELTGRTMEQEYGDGWLERMHPEDRQRWKQAYETAFDERQSFSVEYRMLRADGVFRWLLGHGLPLYLSGTDFAGFIGSCVDISRHKQAEEEKERLLDQERTTRARAEEASRLKDEFLATLSHELRTPLNAIVGWSNLLRRKGGAAKEIDDGLEVIERNARTQTQIIEDLLDMNRIISGKVRLDVRPIELSRVVEEAVETVRPAMQGKDIELSLNFDAAPCRVSGDAARLQQILWNLLSNAVKFTAAGGIVAVTTRNAGGMVELEVRDSGQGIAPAFLPYVFDRFRQADASAARRHGGLGLGLAIVRQLVELHGGTVEAASAGEGKGAVFTVVLPAAANTTAGQETAGQRAGGSQAREEYPLAGTRLLVVDDQEDSRELVRRLLEEAGADVVAAQSAAEALEIARRELPDALISDIAMPETDGYELLRSIRRLRHGSKVRALALTAFGGSDAKHRALKAGYQVHMVKPFEPDSLIQAVREIVRDAGAGHGGPQSSVPAA